MTGDPTPTTVIDRLRYRIEMSKLPRDIAAVMSSESCVYDAPRIGLEMGRLLRCTKPTANTDPGESGGFEVSNAVVMTDVALARSGRLH